MKVQDNLENYEIPRGFRLSVEEEDRFAAIIAEIIPELAKRRKSKLETRKYFKQHLRYDSNVLEDLAEKGIKEDLYEFGQNYTPMEGEYTWRSNLLQPVLLEILDTERLKYGYIINLLQDDMRRRNPEANLRYWDVEDHLIKFSQEFDIEDIRDEIAKMSDIRKRIVYLQTKKADLLVTDLLTEGEKQDWGPEYDTKLNALIALEEKKLELYPNGLDSLTPAAKVQTPDPPKTDYFSKVYSFCHEDRTLTDRIPEFLLKAAGNDTGVLEKPLIQDAFEYVSSEFDRFLDTCDILSNDKINEIFYYVDQWFDYFKETVDSALTYCQQAIKKALRKKEIEGDKDAIDKAVLVFACFVMEKATKVVSGFKANILYNHRYFDDVYYNISGGTVDDFLNDKERLENKFGAGNEREVLFDENANIEAFYEEVLDIVKFGLIEAAVESKQMDEEERLLDYKERLRITIESGISFYMELVKTNFDFSTESYHEALSWVETTRYCVQSVILAAELWVAYNEDMSFMIDYPYFQKVNFEYLPKLLSEALAPYTSETGNGAIDNQLNDLGERDADEWDAEVPKFDYALLTDDFITEADIDAALPADSVTRNQRRIARAVKSAERALKKSDDLLNGPVEIVTYRTKEEKPSPEVKPVPKHKACHLSFYDSVDEPTREILYKYMHDHVGSQPGIEEYLYIKALIDENYLKYPSFTKFAAEFPAYKYKNRNFSHYLGSKGVLKEELSDLHQGKVDTYIKEINVLLGKVD